MTSIVKATVNDSALLSEIAKLTFIESHGHSASPEDVNTYVAEKYSPGILKEELLDPGNIYHIIYYNDRPAGYSKIVLNSPHANATIQRITKLERIYLLKEFYDLKLGRELLEFNVALAKENEQLGMWLFVWKENPKAAGFYKKNGFVIIGSHDFKISETHSNPNHQMFLKF